MIDNKPARSYRQVKVRPLPESVLAMIKNILKTKNWSNIINAASVDEKANLFHSEVMAVVNQVAPQKLRKISSDDQPWYTEQLKKLDRKRRREYQHNRRSIRYYELQRQYKLKCSQENKKFFKKILRQVRQSNPSQWYSTLKRISNHEQEKSKPLQVAEICHLTDKEQAEAIASAFNSISSQYQQVSKEDIQIPDIPAGSFPVITPKQVKTHMEKLKINKATVPDKNS